jgi:hypothetical protein
MRAREVWQVEVRELPMIEYTPEELAAAEAAYASATPERAEC